MLNLKRTYYKDDILILGEGLHTVHPVAGQGFNLVLRDINKLQEILKYYIELGMSLKALQHLKILQTVENMKILLPVLELI